MITPTLEWVVRLRWLIITMLAVGVVVSVYELTRAPLDAIPDISDPQVVVYVKWPRSPQLIEASVTEPVIRALTGTTGVQSVRGTSHMGYSFIYVILADGADRTGVRQVVTDRLNALRPQLPVDAVITLGPNASSMGWAFQYALVDRERLHDLRELRLLNEGQIKSGLQSVAGVAEVASVGGLEKQYQVKLFPPLLSTTGTSLRQVVDALSAAYQEAGGRTIEVTNREYQLRGVLDSADVDQLGSLIIARGANGRSVLLKDVGYVQVGYDLRRSTADLNGTGEVVGGIVIMEQDQNVLSVTRRLQQKLAEIRPALPAGVEIVPTYDRSTWIWATLQQFIGTLLAELVVLILVTVLFLGNIRSSIGPIAILLFSTLFTVLPLSAFGQTINLFSLAGLCIAIGAIEDATIVIVENCATELAAHAGLTRPERRRLILASIARVARPLLFSMLIIVASFLPVFFLEAREARLFDPLAYSKTFAVAISTLLTIVLLPIMMLAVFEHEPTASRLAVAAAGRRPRRGGALIAAVVVVSVVGAGFALGRVVDPDMRAEVLELAGFISVIVVAWALLRRSSAPHHIQGTRPVRLYASMLRATIRHRYAFTATGVLVVVAAALMLRTFPRDFLPDVDEGSVLYMPTTLPGLPTREAGWIIQQMDAKLKAIPEVERVFAKLGRADTSTDPAPVSMIETTIMLKPKSQWRAGMTKAQIVAEMDRQMTIVGYVNTWVQPIRARVMMQTTGIQTPVGIKVKGPDVAEIERISEQVEQALRTVPGTKYVLAERISEGYYTDVRYQLARLAEHGVTADEAMLTVRYGIGGDNLLGIKQVDGTVVPLAVQYSAEYLDTIEKVRTTPVMGVDGAVALIAGRRCLGAQAAGDAAQRQRHALGVHLRRSPGHHGHRLRERGQGDPGPAGEAARRVFARVDRPVRIHRSGRFASAHRDPADAGDHLRPARVHVPVGERGRAGGDVGAVRDGRRRLPAVGAGLRDDDRGDHRLHLGVRRGGADRHHHGHLHPRGAGRKPPSQSFVDAVIEGSTARLRPKLMTVATIVLSLSLIPLSSGPGMEIMKPIAAPSIGGMITSTLHVLFMTPCLFVIADDVRRWWHRRRSAGVTCAGVDARGVRLPADPGGDLVLSGCLAVTACRRAATPASDVAVTGPGADGRRRRTQRSTCVRWIATSVHMRPASARAAAWRWSRRSPTRSSIASTSAPSRCRDRIRPSICSSGCSIPGRTTR